MLRIIFIIHILFTSSFQVIISISTVVIKHLILTSNNIHKQRQEIIFAETSNHGQKYGCMQNLMCGTQK